MNSGKRYFSPQGDGSNKRKSQQPYFVDKRLTPRVKEVGLQLLYKNFLGRSPQNPFYPLPYLAPPPLSDHSVVPKVNLYEE